MLLVLTKILLLLNILYSYLYFSYFLFYLYAGQLVDADHPPHPPQLPDVAQLDSDIIAINTNNITNAVDTIFLACLQSLLIISIF